MKHIISKFAYILSISLFLALGSCDDENPEVIELPLAGFTFELNPDNPREVSFTNTSFDADGLLWDFGDGQGTSTEANPVYTYASGGTFVVTLVATNEAGDDTATQTISVSGFGPNLVSGSDMSDANAWTSKALWTADDNATNHRFENGAFIFASGQDADGNVYAYNNHILYQAVALEAGKSYQFSAMVKSASGTLNTWFEVYFGNEAPVDGADDYTVGGVQLFMKSFGDNENCSSTAFDGDIISVAANGCPMADRNLLQADGTFTVTASDLSADGKIYLLFKAGAWDGNFNEGISLDEVSIKEIL